MSKVTYVGMDVHKDWIVVVWRQAQGAMRRFAVENTPEGWAKLVKVIGAKDVWGAYEASSCGWEVHDRLTEAGWKVSVLAPTHLPQTARGRKTKTDIRDAMKILDVLLAHGEVGTALPEVWIPPGKIREDREIVRRRLKLAEELSAAKAAILSLLRMHGIKRPEALKTSWSNKHVAWLRGQCQEGSPLGRAVRCALSSQMRELEFLQKETEELQREVERLAEEAFYQAQTRKMTELSGVGTLTAMTYLVEIGDVRRFPNRRKIANYLGLTPTSFESGAASDRKGHITRMGPSRVRKVLNQAAWALMRENPEWRKWYAQVAERRGAKKAIVGLMRRLGIELWQRARSA